ncbi:MAG TPA: DUF1028 domain-containing protein [Gaiellaceae bacterium]|nr:DUF1028 domain-containing protein [Gaiellaceae bacterium]
MTYSIVARDAESGELGVGVQSRAFRAGAVVPWAMPGVGAVASQAFGEKSYGTLGLELMRAGKTAEQALAALVAADPVSSHRQVSMLTADGAAAVHTGAGCIPAAGHRIGDGVTGQANCVEGPAVWESMVDAFVGAQGPLQRRLLAALVAAEAAGGDWRGRQAAGILVVPAEGQPWETVCDVRVDDHDDPLAELGRLLDLHEGYTALGEVEDSAAIARRVGLPALDVQFAELFDAVLEGEMDEARELLGRLLAQDERWRSYLQALADLGYLPHAEELLGTGSYEGGTE